jgi:hypothetical protein
VAAELKRETGMDAKLLVGSSGELSVWVDDRKVAEKQAGRFPSPEECVAAVRAALPQQNV